MIIFEQKVNDEKCVIPPITQMSINQMLVVIDDLLKQYKLEVVIEQIENLPTSFWIRPLYPDSELEEGAHRMDTSKIIPI